MVEGFVLFGLGFKGCGLELWGSGSGFTVSGLGLWVGVFRV